MDYCQGNGHTFGVVLAHAVGPVAIICSRCNAGFNVENPAKTCATCRFWLGDSPENKYCDMISDGAVSARAVGRGGDVAVLLTLPTFGCKIWEGK